MEKMDVIDLGPVPDWLVIDAVRYAVGRRTYQVDVTARWLCVVWARLPAHVREIIQRDLEVEFRRDDAMRARGERTCLPLGMDCDRESWAMVRALWLSQDPPPPPSSGSNSGG